MSILPKISLGLSTAKSTFDLGQDTHTTAEIGYFQPTFCRSVVPGSHMEISSHNMVRLSPLAVPTMGRLALRNYYYFVDYATLWTPFDALRTEVNYTFGDGSVSTPQYCPRFNNKELFKYLSQADISVGVSYGGESIRDNIYCTVYTSDDLEKPFSGDVNTPIDAYGEDDSIAEALQNVSSPFIPFILTTVDASGNTKVWRKEVSEAGVHSPAVYSSSTVSQLGDTSRFVTITNQNADFSWMVESTEGKKVYVLGKFLGPAKRLRKIFLGAGYSFNPFDTEYVTPFKLLAIYKAWYDTFAVQRTQNWNHTNANKFIKLMSEKYSSTYKFIKDSDDFEVDEDQEYSIKLFNNFLAELADICYMLPADYFSASDVTGQRGAYTTDSNNVSFRSWQQAVQYGYPSNVTASASYQQTPIASDTSAMAMNMAQSLLKFVNKRSVIGRKIADLLKLNGEVDIHNNEHETVHHLGQDATTINISDVMSLASTDDASLGDYAGRGIGLGGNDTFSYDTKAYGVLLCLSAIIPQSGYFQGTLHENKDNERFDWFTDEFDALGYQNLDFDELVSDNQFMSADGNINQGTQGVFGIVPRYQHLKVGRNICNGDMSLPSMQSVMLPYTLDRHFTTFVPDLTTKCKYKDFVLPSNTPETFRKCQATSGYGDYNRIFQYVNGDYDHFIMQMVFDAKVTSPMKSISQSYDTFNEENDNASINVEHM